MKVVFVVGSTASGKSNFALNLAEKHNGAIVNCDSIQIYKRVNIGSAKPSPEDRARAPHFLYDLIDYPEEMTAGLYRNFFFEKLKELEKTFPVVFVVGGTGFYFQAIEKGMYPVGAADSVTKQRVLDELAEPQGALRLHEELKSKDPVSAARISIHDVYRLGRAIEIIRIHQKTLIEVQKEFQAQQKPFPYPLQKLGVFVNKEELLIRVQNRAKFMLKAGFISEVENLLKEVPETWAPLQSVGYKEVVLFLKNQSKTLEGINKLEEMIVQSTMKLAKKQRTWFKRDNSISWLAPESNNFCGLHPL